MIRGNTIDTTYGSLDVEWDVFSDGRDTVLAQITTKYGGTLFSGVGSSRKSVEDDWNYEIGAGFAIGRALEDLGRQLQKRAWRVVQA